MRSCGHGLWARARVRTPWLCVHVCFAHASFVLRACFLHVFVRACVRAFTLCMLCVCASVSTSVGLSIRGEAHGGRLREYAAAAFKHDAAHATCCMHATAVEKVTGLLFTTEEDGSQSDAALAAEARSTTCVNGAPRPSFVPMPKHLSDKAGPSDRCTMPS